MSRQTRRGWNDPRICASEDCENEVVRKGAWICDECENKRDLEITRMENLRDDENMRKIDERRGK
jgi:hypothetical protein